MFWTPPSIPWLTLCLWFIWFGTASWNFLVTSFECQRKSLLEDMLCTFQPLAKGDLVDHILHTLSMYKDCLGIMKEQCKNSRLPLLLMIVVHGETLWSPLCSWWMMITVCKECCTGSMIELTRDSYGFHKRKNNGILYDSQIHLKASLFNQLTCN